jgi:hypothetical protein
MDHHHDPAEAPEAEIVGKPTLLATYEGRLEAEHILNCLGRAGYPVEDVSVLFKVGGSDEVLDLRTGHPAAGQAINEEKLKPKLLTHGQTAVLLHPTPEQVDAVRQALSEVGTPDIKYSGETHVFGRPGSPDRVDDLNAPGEPEGRAT